MTPLRRWCVWAGGVALLVGVPVAVRVAPVGDTDVSAADLVAQVREAQDRPWSGYVETVGTLQLPAADRFEGVGALFGEQTRMRVWWRGEDDWRVDRLLVAGEDDLVHDAGTTTEWDYEDAEATVSRDPDIRLPRTSDLVPPQLAERVLTDVSADDVTRLPARRVAGVSAPGLEVRPASAASSIDRVHLWVDPATGVALRVDVYAAGEDSPSFTSELREFSSDEPPAARTDLDPPDGVEVSFEDVLDIADAADQYAPLRPPSVVGGLERSGPSDGAVGVYGTGLTQLIAIPLRGREAGPLREQLQSTPGSVLVPRGTAVAVGPLGVVLSGREDDDEGGWLVAGTVTRDTLVRAARDLLEGTTYVERR